MTISKTQLKGFNITKLLHFFRNLIILITLGYSSAYSADIEGMVTIDDNSGKIEIDRQQVQDTISLINKKLQEIDQNIELSNKVQNEAITKGKQLALVFRSSIDVYAKCEVSKRQYDQRRTNNDFVNLDSKESFKKMVDKCYKEDYRQVDNIFDQYEIVFNNIINRLYVVKDEVRQGELEAQILIAKKAFYQALLDSASTNLESSD